MAAESMVAVPPPGGSAVQPVLVPLRCRHVFHRECLDSWLLRPRATCPLCRDRLLPCEPPRACARALDDDEIYVDEHEDPPSSSSSSYSHDAALWHM
ncbi:E3 ubiquitin-protein ligase RNF13 [Triticum urartu]|uniref:E3 ubiquitin-protein ligase RNF13 n=1 Tax=Triticum urartu TaxID=4572 RepID=M7ZKC9_TRIUA|nr:E3 ubiquitin-protein ligase RNF13 [Triticum urartu]